MKAQIQGTTPKKIIKRTHNRNPTLHSYHMIEVMQPSLIDPQKLNQSRMSDDKNYLKGNQKLLESRTAKFINADSLSQAEYDFSNRKKSHLYIPINPYCPELPNHRLPFGSPLAYRSSSSLDTKSNINSNLFFKNAEIIRSKQSLKYDIISNISYQ